MSSYRVTYTVLIELDESNTTARDAAEAVSAALWEIGQDSGEPARLIYAELVHAEEVQP